MTDDPSEKGFERKLLNLLAVIHRDGGHYTVENGLEQSFKDAMQISSNRIRFESENAELKAQVEKTK